MKSRDILVAGILSVQALCGLAENQQPIFEAREISIQDALGGVQNLINRGLLKPIDDSKRNKARRRRAEKSGKKSSAQYGDEPIATERVRLLMEAFQDATSVTIAPAFSSEGDLTVPGTVFLYSDAQFQNKTLIGSGAPPSGVVQGSCTRTDPVTSGSDGYEGKAYCHFVYEFFDIDGQTVIATLTAEGPVANGGMSSLAITGGSGELRRTIGQIDLYPSTVDYTSVPPTITNDPSLDFLGDGMNEGYELSAYLFVDPVAVLY